MADPPFVLLLIAPDEADRRRIGELLTDAQAEVHWVTTRGVRRSRPPPSTRTTRCSSTPTWPTTPRCTACWRRIRGAQIILLGDPSGADAVRRARLSGAIDHLPKAGLDTDTLERAVRYAADHRRSVERLEHTRDARRAHRAAEPDAVPRPARAVAAPVPAGGGPAAWARSSSSTSTASRSSTTRSATRSGDELLRAVAQRLDAAAPPRRHRRAHGRRRVHGAARGRRRPARGHRGRRARARHAERPVPGRRARAARLLLDRDRARGAGRRPGGADPRRRRRDVPRQGRGQGAPRGLRRAHAPPRARPPQPGDRPAPRHRARGPAGPLPADLPHRHGARSPASRRSAAGRWSPTSSSRWPRRPG